MLDFNFNIYEKSIIRRNDEEDVKFSDENKLVNNNEPRLKCNGAIFLNNKKNARNSYGYICKNKEFVCRQYFCKSFS